MRRFSLLLSVVFCVLSFQNSNAQRIALKTNVLELATLSPNLGITFRTSRHFTMGFDLIANPVSINKYKLTFVGIDGEGRYWFSRVMARHFVGVIGLAESHNFRFDTNYHKGDAFAAGLVYGYAWPISKRWNIEASVGAGLVHYRDMKWKEGESAPSSPNNTKTVLAPIKADISFSYILK